MNKLNYLTVILVVEVLITMLDGKNILDQNQDRKKHHLEEALLGNYNANVDRPIKFDRVTKVYLDMYLYQILEVNSKQQYLIVSVWMTQSWEDDYLFWDPSEHNGTSLLHIPSSLIWKPDTYLMNKVDLGDTELFMTAVLNPVVSTGQLGSYNTTWVTLDYPALYKISCLMNMMYFPWDTQICTLSFSSWSYVMTDIDYDFLITDEHDRTEHYITNQEFDLVENDAQRKIFSMNRTYPHGSIITQFTLMEFTIRIRRMALYYIVNLVIPSFVLTVMSILGFFSPSSSTGERTEKVSLGIAAISALFIMLLVIGDQMPKTSVVIPIIGYYFLALMSLTVLALIATKVVLHLHKKALEGQPIPQWLTWLEFTLPPNRKICFSCGKKKVCKRRSSKKDRNNLCLEGLNNDLDNPFPAVSKELGDELSQQQPDDTDGGQAARSHWDKNIEFFEKVLCIFFIVLACVATGILLVIGFCADQR